MRSGEVVVVRRYGSLAAAEFAKARLEAEGISALVEPSDPVVGPIASVSSGVRLLVDAAQRFRAEAILEESDVSEAELDALATRGRREGSADEGPA